MTAPKYTQFVKAPPSPGEPVLKVKTAVWANAEDELERESLR
jgi:hypothetical protein